MSVDKKHRHETKDEKNIFQIVGFAVLSLCVVGIASAVFSAIAIIGERDFLGGGVLCLASVLSFGLLLHAFIRR